MCRLCRGATYNGSELRVKLHASQQKRTTILRVVSFFYFYNKISITRNRKKTPAGGSTKCFAFSIYYQLKNFFL